MSKLHTEITQANNAYAAEFVKTDKPKLPLPPGRNVAILTCMDARIITSKALGLSEGDAHVIRNAGGRASDDAIRSLVISTRLLGTREWFVIHHTDCGMLLFNDDVMSDLLKEGVYTATYPTLTGGKGPSSTEGKYIKWHTFKDLAASVVEDVHRIASHPLVPADVKIYGFIFDVATGKINPVEGASRI